jgi:mono/diheme cytochrome c family protein
MKPRGMVLYLTVMVLVVGSRSQGQTVGSRSTPVTAVTGESWLNHLHRPFNETSMGKTGHLGPPPPISGEESPSWQMQLSSNMMRATTLHGSDLYRLNCQGCHGESGQGAPPEINSVINPVRATSVAAVLERMKSTGLDISRADATKLAQQSRTALLQRLHNGGESMPAFSHLSEAEIRSLLAYLKQLAGVTGAESEQVPVSESPLRIGEHIVKSTCHTCHGAAGNDPTPQQLLDGAIPPLSTLATRVSEAGLIRKVTYGAPIVMGTPAMPYRGRMPVFYYLTQQEAAEVYLYLTTYSPSEPGTQGMPIVLSKQDSGPSGAPPAQLSASGSQLMAREGTRPLQASSGYNARTIALLVAAALFVLLLLGGGLGFTIHEFKRLSEESERRQWQKLTPTTLMVVSQIKKTAGEHVLERSPSPSYQTNLRCECRSHITGVCDVRHSLR